MNDALRVTAWGLLVATGAAWAYWLIVAWRVARAVRAVPHVRAGLAAPPPAGGWPRVSIVVPAHNEQRVIERCVTALRAQTYAPLELIFVCDRCTDQTIAILAAHAQADPRLIVIENASCPDDWAGKCNAAHVGAGRATGEWILFTDADTQFDAELVRAAMGLALKRELDLLSLLGTLTARLPFEQIVQPVASRALLRMFPLDQVNRPGSPRVFANGQFMLFCRDSYQRIGGHAAVRADLLEDIAFARLLRARDGRSGVFLAGSMLMVSMYESMDQFRAGWRRIFIEACKRKPKRLRKNGRALLIGGALLPFAQIAGLAVAIALFTLGSPPLGAALLVTSVAGWLAQLLVLQRVYRLAGAPVRAALLYPIGAWMVGRIMLEAARDLEAGRPVRWGGREYVLEPR